MTFQMQHIHGAPNFRRAAGDICGVAQPSVAGLIAIYHILKNGNEAGVPPSWLCIRDEPVIYLDGLPFVLREAGDPLQNMRAFSGISADRVETLESRLVEDILTEIKSNNGLVVIHEEHEKDNVKAVLMAPSKVASTRQVFEELEIHGYRYNYFRIPISHEQSPTESFVDNILECFKTLSSNNAPMIFSCGMGVGRTTYAMIIATIYKGIPRGLGGSVNNITLQLIYNLDKALEGTFSTIDWIMKREALVERLEEASQGNYQIVRDLIKVIDDGKHCKDAVDSAIDNNSFLLNLRNQILISRVNYAVTKNPNSLGYALDCLERYFSIIVFKSYLMSNSGETVSFNSWMHNQRPEIWNMYSSIRKRRSEKLKIFRPIDDLSVLAETHLNISSRVGESAGETLVVKNRTGVILSSNTILKSDHWQQPLPEEAGAPNFRQIGNFPVFAVAQPTLEGIKQVLSKASVNGAPILWINLREEPLVYINGEPYVLRDHFATLRNIKVFSGISRDRLEGMEETLKDEIFKESKMYEGRILVHEEVAGQLVATWENLKQVETTSKIFSSFQGLEYFRIPITAEDAPDPCDLDSFKEILDKKDPKIIVILNCQMGIGRSTIGTIISMLIFKIPLKHQPFSSFSVELMDFEVINSLVRMLPEGIDVKEHLDRVIEACSQKFNLIKNIHDVSGELLASLDPIKSSQSIRKLIFSLKRYFLLLCFTQYIREEGLNKVECSISPSASSFKKWFERHEEIKVLFNELEKGRFIERIAHMNSSKTPIGGTELWKALKGRRGSVLAPLTILKFDHFPGCHRMSLPQRIEGAPNFRGIAIPTTPGRGINIYGVAMPTACAINSIISMLTQHGRKLTWVCLREEPVIYVNGQPFVLRIVRDPNDNVAMTGIDPDRVELIEQRLLEEVQRESHDHNGKILLHEEGIDEPLVPMWEPLESLKTMSQVFSELDIKYYRLPITDEQAPIPKVFDEVARIVRESEDLIFNCQMGRGRTTTGMIITTIMTLISTRKHSANNHINGNGSSSSTSGNSMEEEGNSTTEEKETRRFLSGEYRVITLLTQLLQNGKKSKQITDEAIDLCSHLQNLRESIFSYKQRLQPSDNNGASLNNPNIFLDEEERRYIELQGRNYLTRYFYLICFSEYYFYYNSTEIDSDADGEDGRNVNDFSEWLSERREIGNLARKIDFS